MRRLQLLRLDFDSTSVRLPIKRHSGVTRAADPLAAVTLTYIYLLRPSRVVVDFQSNGSRIEVES